jgi:bifunctional DNA-binding transcriptional regulator/antitoxin component of YhaV-PrlF toxin-antitoxin module
MSKSTDERGRIYLPKDVRDRFGTEFRVVELPNYVALFPVAEDPIEAVRDAIGDELAGKSVEELKTEAREKSREQVSTEREEQ